MIFGISAVCIQYFLGVVTATFLIRRFCLIGGGYYWLMYSFASVLALFASISSSGVVRIASLVCLLLALGALSYSIVYRSLMKEPTTFIEVLLHLLLIAAATAASLILVFDEVSSSFIVVESLRIIMGGLLLGGVTTTMLLGHWYLVQPGISRAPIERLSELCIGVVTIVSILWLFNPSMISVLTGEKSDGWGGTLGYMWIGSAVTTIVLLIAGRLALKEKSYTAVMATTGLLYLAILVANGVELIPRTIFG